MGMRPSVFWTGWAITAVITSLYVSLLVIASGNLCAFLSPTFCLRPAASSSRRIISQAFTLFSRCLLFRLPSSRSVYTPSASLLLSSLCTQSQIAQILEGDVTHRFPHFSLTCFYFNRSVGVLVFLVLGARTMFPFSFSVPPHRLFRHCPLQHRTRLLCRCRFHEGEVAALYCDVF
jgi:hypothetical protein